MKTTRYDALVSALLYEGYLLYPYRASSLKNHGHRFAFGTLYPPRFDGVPEGYERSAQQLECLVLGAAPRLEVRVRFLRLVARSRAGSDETWQEAEEQTLGMVGVTLADARPGKPRVLPFTLDAEEKSREAEALRSALITGRIEVSLRPLDEKTARLRVRVENHTPMPEGLDEKARRDEGQLRALASAHILVGVEGGAFASMIDPPARVGAHVGACQNEGCYPVLVGGSSEEPHEADAILASPIILYDNPRLAPESAGDLFDSTEIDEILSLRILTLTDEEKAQVRATDPRGRALLERTEALGAAGLARLHGARRDARRLPAVGDAVRLRPRSRGDAFDLFLADKEAHVVAVEQDFEGRVLIGVTLDDDPGRDLGETGQVGHRFFFAPDELVYA